MALSCAAVSSSSGSRSIRLFRNVCAVTNTTVPESILNICGSVDPDPAAYRVPDISARELIDHTATDTDRHDAISTAPSLARLRDDAPGCPGRGFI